MSAEEDSFEVNSNLHESKVGNFYVFPGTEDTDCIEGNQIIEIL